MMNILPGLILLILLIRYAGILRLTIPVLYALIVPTVFHSWYNAHYVLANGIWYGMLVLVVLSWAYSILRRVRG